MNLGGECNNEYSVHGSVSSIGSIGRIESIDRHHSSGTSTGQAQE